MVDLPFLGHVNMATTIIYIHKDAQNTFQPSHPS
jgi:hypothetical protein